MVVKVLDEKIEVTGTFHDLDDLIEVLLQLRNGNLPIFYMLSGNDSKIVKMRSLDYLIFTLELYGDYTIFDFLQEDSSEDS